MDGTCTTVKPTTESKKHVTARHVQPEQVLQLKIVLKDIKPPVWRRVLVKDSITFERLHAAIQDSFGWADYHLHEFSFKSRGRFNQRIVIYQDDVDACENNGDYKERDIRLRDVFPRETDRMLYTSDFGDNWEHVIHLEGVVPVDPGLDYPDCIKSKGECPEEDSGGPFGWMARNENDADNDEADEDDDD